MANKAPAKDDKFTEKAVEVFRACARVPVASRARIESSSEGRVQVEVTWTQREIERGKKVSYNRTYFVENGLEGLKKLCTSSCQPAVSNVVKVATVVGCKKKAVLVNDKVQGAEPTAEPQQFIEVWGEEGLEKTISVADLKDHGKIHEDIHFGSFQLFPGGTHLLYIAEKKKPKSASYFSKTSSNGEDTPPNKGADFAYEESWGEQLTSVVNPVPVVLDLTSENTTVIDTEQVGDISAGQAVCVPKEEGGVVFMGWENTPRKLGFIYCPCRNSAVYHANFKTGKCTKLTSSEYNLSNPRFSPDGSKLVYFRAVSRGPHHTCAALMMMNWASKEVTTVVDVVNRPDLPTSFPGLYAVFLPERCWDNSGTRLLLHNTWGCYVEVTEVNVETGEVTNVSGPDRKGAWQVLDVSCDLVVAQYTSLNTCPQLYIGTFPANSADSVVWTELDAYTSHVTDGLTWKKLEFTPCDDNPYQSPYEGLLLRPASATPPPLVVLPHGGPHTAIPADFLVWPACLAALGYAVLMVNYRGSMGYGQDCIFSLPGRVGTQDVKDVQDAAVAVVKNEQVDGGRVCVTGGSHGGFLSAHLIGQFPDFYKAAVIRNPVIDISVMWGISDIPDWCCVEGGVTYDPATPPSSEDMGKMHSMSPIMHVKKVQAPVMLHIGGCDLRCPPAQGLLYYKTLRALGKQAKLLYYPKDNHPINTVQSDADAFLNMAVWFQSNVAS